MPPQKSDFVSAPIGKTMLKTAVPMLAGTLALSGYNIADTYFIGKLGENELAAVGFTMPVAMFAGCIFHGLGTGMMTLVAHALGGERQERAASITTAGFALIILLTSLLALAGIFTMKPVFSLLGATPELHEMIQEYMLVWYIGTPLLVIGMAGNSILITAADSRLASTMMIVGMLINVILDPILIFGWWIIPGTGIFGGALATVISQGVSAVIILLLIWKKHHLISRVPLDFRFLQKVWLMVLRVAIPSILGMVLMPIGSAIVTKAISFFGKASVAGANAAARLEGVAFLVPMALGMSMMPMIGQNFGAKRFDRINQCRRFAMRFALAYELGLAVLIFLFAPQISAIFCSESPEGAEVMTQYLRIVPFGFGFLEAHRYSGFVFTGCNRPAASAWLSALRIIGCLIPFTLLAAKFGNMNWIFAARLSADVISGIIGMTCAHLLTWRLLRENTVK
ncbi:MAG: MATE family efflux transporter [Lentisphaerae bacterium]|nr:MATE family efflux transporter [Lentisphaerota bacterium]